MFVYILHSQKFKRFYVGITSDLDSRLNAHNSGHVKSTKAYIPWVYVYTEEKSDRMEARQREKYLKSAAGRRWRKINLGM